MVVRVIHGDCLTELRMLAEGGERFHACVTDPPYHLTSIVERFGADNAAPALSASQRRFAKTGGAAGAPGSDQYGRLSTGFMGKVWDGGDVAFRPETWRAVYECLLPGAHLLAFGGTRGWHRLACAIESAGFEIRDTICWLYASGFPKSHAVPHCSRIVTRQEFDGWGTALKPAWEPVIVARRPLVGTVVANVLQHGTGAINIDASRVPLASDDPLQNGITGRTGSALDTAENDGVWGFKAVDRVAGLGRWPANVIHDGSDEVEAAFPQAPGQQRDVDPSASSSKTKNVYGKMNREGELSADRRYADKGSTNFAAMPGQRRTDAGSASRFFYTAKADAVDRQGSKHPTVKPTDLMRYLVQLVMPPGGTVLDPFAGTGTTGLAADQLGFDAVLIERDATYVEDIKRKLTADAPLLTKIL